MYQKDRFNRGSAVYKCEMCGKQTRETGGGESELRLCNDCFTECSLENSINDGHEECLFCGNRKDFTINAKRGNLTCNNCGAQGTGNAWIQPIKENRQTDDEKKAKRKARRAARKAAKQAAQAKLVKCNDCINLGGLKTTQNGEFHCPCADLYIVSIYDQHPCERYMFYD